MKTKMERFILGLILAPLSPLALFLGSWWTAYAVLPEKWISVCAFFGLGFGLLADIFLLKKLIDRADTLSSIFWAVVFLIYSVGLFGFFMGVPIFNVGLVVPAGLILGWRLAAGKADGKHARSAIRCAGGFTTIVLALICAASAFFALVDPYTEANLQGMFGLPFEVTRGMVFALIAAGGISLLAANWWLTCSVARFSYKFFQRWA